MTTLSADSLRSVDASISLTTVVGRRGLEAQTKESARRDKRPSRGYCVAIYFYCVAVDHLFLLCGSKPYAGWRQPVCHLFLLCRSKPSVSIVSVKTICCAICYESYHLLVRLLVT